MRYYGDGSVHERELIGTCIGQRQHLLMFSFPFFFVFCRFAFGLTATFAFLTGPDSPPTEFLFDATSGSQDQPLAGRLQIRGLERDFPLFVVNVVLNALIDYYQAST